MSKTAIIAKWKPLLEKEGMPEIATMKRKDIVARLMETNMKTSRVTTVLHIPTKP